MNIADIEYSHGLKGLGASDNGDEYLSRPGGRSDFSKATLYAARIQSLPANWSVVVAANGQYAFTDLLAPELFSVGGEQFGRGYDASELLNDHGAALKIDLRYAHTWGGRRPVTLMPYIFGDAGRVWQRTPFAGGESQQTLSSAGGGACQAVTKLQPDRNEEVIGARHSQLIATMEPSMHESSFQTLPPAPARTVHGQAVPATSRRSPVVVSWRPVGSTGRAA